MSVTTGGVEVQVVVLVTGLMLSTLLQYGVAAELLLQALTMGPAQLA